LLIAAHSALAGYHFCCHVGDLLHHPELNLLQGVGDALGVGQEGVVDMLLDVLLFLFKSSTEFCVYLQKSSLELLGLHLDERSLRLHLILKVVYLGMHGFLLLLPLKGTRRPLHPLDGLHVRGGVCLILRDDQLCSNFGFRLSLCKGVCGPGSLGRAGSGVHGLHKKAARQTGEGPRGWKWLFTKKTSLLLWYIRVQQVGILLIDEMMG
jgi:hypothetical protein